MYDFGDKTPDDLEIHINAAGGVGRGALWKWGVYFKGAGAVASGITKGARAKAQAAADAALADITLSYHQKKNAR